METLPQELIDRITMLLDLESIMVFRRVFKRNVYIATKEHYKPNDVHTWDNCAKNGWLNTLKFLESESVPGCSTSTLDIAAENGMINVVKWLVDHRDQECTSKAFDMACANRYYNVVVYLYFATDVKYRYYNTMNFIILLDCLKQVYLDALDHPVTDDLYDISESVTDCIKTLSFAKSQTECYENLDVLQYVYIGAVLARKKLAGLIRDYIEREMGLQQKNSRIYFKYCDEIIKRLS